MKVLVTGANGFVGQHMLRELEQSGHEAIASGLTPEAKEPSLVPLDICNPEQRQSVLAELKPDAVIHLAGMAFVPQADANPQLAFEVNVKGAIGMLEDFSACQPKGKFLLASSAEVYGNLNGRSEAVREDEPLMPVNLYAVTKAAADASLLLIGKKRELHVMTARPQNHIGPGQSPKFVTSSFASQMAEIARGESEPIMRVGNLDSEKNFTDVRDIVRAYRLLIERGAPNQAYNIASPKHTRIRELFDLLADIAGISPKVEVEPKYFRPTEVAPYLNTDALQAQTNWKPGIPLRKTVEDLYQSLLQDTVANGDKEADSGDPA